MTNSINRKQRLMQECKPRQGEKIGGGFIIGHRIGNVGRIIFSGIPYEHESMEDAAARASKMAQEFPDRRFIVLAVASEIAAS